MPERSHNNRTKIIVAALGVFAVAALVALGFSLFRLGEKSEKEAASAGVEALATSVQEKSDTLEKLDKIMSDVPETVDQEGIATYISNLQTLINETSDESVKSALKTYLAQWQHLQDIYGDKDNEAIAKAFEDIQASAASAAEEIQSALDSRITSALDALTHN